ncbi:MAG TPA: carboxylating nicotinate-nucleotide diphosphorylase [Candidatus Tripitaka californicus]|uniref:carboxylating nicotinate-nucleotide diphosphorylase n=1 Tax=Candidatus Tripitaka californicus TaxID=3367616 RepID=UPI004024D65D|nr:carboxylating nicotinate-nucleotide diphosphorylase [Planctomycetota bacterium]
MLEPLDLKEIDQLIEMAIREDIGGGDVTTDVLVPEWQTARGEVMAKETGVVAGLPVASRVYQQINKKVSFSPNVEEGARVLPGRVLAEVSGPARGILAGERVALNFIQRLSGIATLTALFVEKIKDYHAKIYDTRKTVPGWRSLEKYAVRVGGGLNHRMGLYDQVLIKDNHLMALEAGKALAKGVRLAREKAPQWMLIEVEVKTPEELEEAIAAKPDIILLDNMTVEEIAKAAKSIRQTHPLHPPMVEVSGGVTLENVEAIARTGVDRISVGALTHSAKALDISLKM